ncbi:hypothetical protein PsAD14_00556 [Pseudovibrio sp. Ad14]|nr:hypothetical protein PsW74_01230 [Pseudovibrio sp. W74]KZL12388.1 hypothetical protein PsAD14_00556 [Pseudovibrio sp. Ad14]
MMCSVSLRWVGTMLDPVSHHLGTFGWLIGAELRKGALA